MFVLYVSSFTSALCDVLVILYDSKKGIRDQPNEPHPVLIEDTIKCPKGALTIRELDPKYILTRVSFVQSQVLFPKPLLFPYQPFMACLYDKITFSTLN